MTARCFLDEERLILGPWQAFERDIARLLVLSGFDDVRIVAGSGDRGADILAVRGGKLWVWQCKFTSYGPPSRSAIDEVLNAGMHYKADVLSIACSRPAPESMRMEVLRLKRNGLSIKLAEPSTLLRIADACPEMPPSTRILRPYQETAVDAVVATLRSTGRAQVVMATGLGKTVVAAETASRLLVDQILPEGRVLVLAHTRDLVSQLHRAFWHHLPRWVQSNQLGDGERPKDWRGLTFATIQTCLPISKELPTFDLVIVDEAHHAGSASFREVLRELRPGLLLGTTATPWRGDGFQLDDLFGPPTVQVSIADGLRGGFLSDVDYRLFADNLDWDEVSRLSLHNYSLPQLNRKLIIPVRDEQAARIVAETFRSEGRRSVICYSPSIHHAVEFAGTLRFFGLRAETLSGETPQREREVLMARFRAGEIDALTTVDLFNEGVDVPDVDTLVFLRSTHSRRIFVQQLGRGLRLKADGSRVVVLDFVTDLRRVAEVLDLDRQVRAGDVESLGLGSRIVRFRDAGAGDFLREWALDQASLLLRQEDPTLDTPDLDFPPQPPMGAVQ